ncbi:hypothetical protein ACIBG0_37020 [Nocardia sp. NPDC050630]|uniref:hypothetical protein n=1 Tax=Nocardia sp. NPDC050630 TaxID=3364321 RepID=UPI0037941428
MNYYEPKFDEGAAALVASKYREGWVPSRILREMSTLYPDVSTLDLMELMQNAFNLPYPAVQCIGGWWMDGTGELSDTELDAFLNEEIAKVLPRCGRDGKRDSKQ